MSDKTTIVNLADEHQGHQNQYRLYFLRLLSKVKICLVFNNMHQILPILKVRFYQKTLIFLS